MTIVIIVNAAMITVLAATLVSATIQPTVTTVQVSTDRLPAVNRTSRVLRAEPVEENSTSPVEFSEHRTIGRKLSSLDDFRTLSSMSSDVVVEASATATIPKLYPSLTTVSPVGHVTRGRYIRNPFGMFGKDEQDNMEFDDDHHADFMFNSGSSNLMGGMPKWNRYDVHHGHAYIFT